MGSDLVVRVRGTSCHLSVIVEVEGGSGWLSLVVTAPQGTAKPAAAATQLPTAQLESSRVSRLPGNAYPT